MTDRQGIQARAVVKRVRARLNSHPVCAEFFDAALLGQADGEDLIKLAPVELSGLIVVALYLNKVPARVYKWALRTAWFRDYSWISKSAQAERIPLFNLLRAAAFAAPDHLPDDVIVFRGTVGMSHEVAGRGLSWTTVFGYACQYADAWHHKRRAAMGPLTHPLVVRATIPRSSIIYFTEEISGSDEVIFDFPGIVTEIAGSGERLSDEARAWRLAAAEVLAAMGGGLP